MAARSGVPPQRARFPGGIADERPESAADREPHRPMPTDPVGGRARGRLRRSDDPVRVGMAPAGERPFHHRPERAAGNGTAPRLQHRRLRGGDVAVGAAALPDHAYDVGRRAAGRRNRVHDGGSDEPVLRVLCVRRSRRRISLGASRSHARDRRERGRLPCDDRVLGLRKLEPLHHAAGLSRDRRLHGRLPRPAEARAAAGDPAARGGGAAPPDRARPARRVRAGPGRHQPAHRRMPAVAPAEPSLRRLESTWKKRSPS
jgi:hypothetical protein